jgi:glycerophosphoryl diester phosphodiesterase
MNKAALATAVILPVLLFPALRVEGQHAAVNQRAAGRPLIIAHRGGARESTENTIEAFQRAAKIGAHGIETDLRLTRDGVVVVYHDQYFGRVEGLPKPQQTRLISDMTYSELSSSTLLPVGDDSGGRKAPTLDELLRSVRGVLLNLELKRGARFGELVKKTAAALKSFRELDRVVLEVPGLDIAKTFRQELGPQLKLHINPGYDDSVPFAVSLERVLKFKPHSISVSHKKLSIEIVEAAHKAGVEVWTWTVDSPEMARAMAVLGADAIKTDRPGLLLESFGGKPAGTKGFSISASPRLPESIL